MNDARTLRRRKLVERLAVALCAAALLVALFPLAHIVYTALSIGGRVLSWTFLTQPSAGSPYRGTQGGAWNGIAGTTLLLFLGGLVAVPVGVSAGVYLADFGDGRTGAVVRTLGDTLLGVPSIVWGLFGYILFASLISPMGLHWAYSPLAGGVTLGLIMTPIVARVTELALRDVPAAFREASLALGATRWATMRRIGLRVAFPGIVTGVLLAVTNAVGQTVALLLTNNYNPQTPRWPIVGQGSTVTDLGTMIYIYLGQPTPLLKPPAEAASVVLLVLVLIISVASRALVALGRRTYVG